MTAPEASSPAGPQTTAPAVAAVPAGRPLVVGANHRSSSLTLRDRLFVEDAAVPAFLDGLRGRGLDQALVLSTCDRVEVVAAHDDFEAGVRAITAAFAEHAGLAPADLSGQMYQFVGDEAVRHVFTVAASLDSLVVGEPQVLGQVKDAHRLARDAGTVGPELEALMQAAYAGAKRVRTETAIGRGPVSIAAAAVQLARDLHGDLERVGVLLVGAGDMGELVAEAFREAGAAHLTVTHPTAARAGGAARTLDCHTAPFSDLPALLVDADVVLTSVNTRDHTLGADVVRAALKARRRRPMFVVDTGIPGDVDPAVDRLDEAFLYDLNDLERVAMQGRASRQAEARAARDIVAAEVADYLRGRAARAAVPALTALRQRFETERERVLGECGNDAERATQLLVNRLLHVPSEVLRKMAAEATMQGGLPDGEAGPDAWQALERALTELFRLDGTRETDT